MNNPLLISVPQAKTLLLLLEEKKCTTTNIMLNLKNITRFIYPYLAAQPKTTSPAFFPAAQVPQAEGDDELIPIFPHKR